MSRDQPLNNHPKFGHPGEGMVLISESRLVRYTAARLTMLSDLEWCRGYVNNVLALTQQLIRAAAPPTQEEYRTGYERWTLGVLFYGRCFMSSDGRRHLTASDVRRFGGNEGAHELLMEIRHDAVAHASMGRRRIEMYACFDTPIPTRITNLSFIESFPDIPSEDELVSCASHLDSLISGLFAEQKEAQGRIAERLNSDHLADLLTHLESGRPWPPQDPSST